MNSSSERRWHDAASKACSTSASRSLLVFLLAVLSIALLAPAAAPAEESGPELTDPQAAEELPHKDLNREQAIDLLNSVFNVQVQSSAGIFDDLNVARFTSDYTAVIEGGQRPEAVGVVTDDDPDHGDYQGNLLLESSVPIRIEQPDGTAEAIDLSLVPSASGLEPSNPHVDVSLPSDLDDGIEFPGSGIEITLPGATPSVSPSVVEDSVALYPNIAEDTDFTAGPTAEGLETMTQLRTPDAPTVQRFELSLPSDATLTASDDGAVVTGADGHPLLEVHAPTAIDASGASVPVSMSIDGQTLVITTTPPEDASWPILVDPLFDEFNWGTTGTPGGFTQWTPETKGTGFKTETAVSCSVCFPFPSAGAGIAAHTTGTGGFLNQGPTTTGAGDVAGWNYWVPRFKSDFETYGVRPQSFVSDLYLTDVYVNGYSGETPLNSGVQMQSGIWDETANTWASAGSVLTIPGQASNQETQYTIPGNNNQNAKKAVGVRLISPTSIALKGMRDAYVGQINVAIGDTGKPVVASLTPPTGWVNEALPPTPFKASDAGVGVYTLRVNEKQATPAAEELGYRWFAETENKCNGGAALPCPREWTGNVGYKPNALSTGIHSMRAYAIDATGVSYSPSSCTCVSNPWEFTLKVDHTAPTVTFGGSVTEQAALGKKRPRYILKVEAKDGTEAAPQSGVVSIITKIDGIVKDEYKPGCATQNCSQTRAVILKNLDYSVGKHTISVTAKDAVGKETISTSSFEIERDTTKPVVIPMGPLVEGPDLWLNENGIYASSPIAEDPGGFGVTKLELLIDNVVIGTPKTQLCDDGACAMIGGFTANLTGYAGGNHSVVFRATDGAGNVGTSTTIVHVNPLGVATNAEIAATMAAAEVTGETVTVMPTNQAISEEERNAGNNPALVVAGTAITTTGAKAETSLTTKPSDGFTIQTPDEAVSVKPTSVAGATLSTVTNSIAAVSSNAASGTDVVQRPVYDGLQTFQDIREGAAPESYSWTVTLNAGNVLTSIDTQTAEIYDAQGEPVMMIKAEKAHDATGKEVPTTLSVSEGKVLTLTVLHKGKGFTYPIVGGPSWEVGTATVTIFTPPPPGPPPTATEEYWDSAQLIVSAPEPIPSGEASASNTGGSRKKYVRTICGHSDFKRSNESFKQFCGNPFLNEAGYQTPWHAAMRGAFFYKPGKYASHNEARACDQGAWETSILWIYQVKEAEKCRYAPVTGAGNGGNFVTAGHYMMAQAKWEVGHIARCAGGCPGENPTIWEAKALELRLWPSGDVSWVVP